MKRLILFSMLACINAFAQQYEFKTIAHSDDVDQSFQSDADQNGAKRRRALSL